MNPLVILFAVVVAVSAQRSGVDPKNAAILAEARYLSGDGSFGAAYVQEDGVEFKEETGQNGERKGQYSYVDPSGKTITVRYTAGKEGFKVEGDHLPKAPAGVPTQPAPYRAPQYNNQPAPQYNSQPQYNAISAPQRGEDGEDGQYRPEVHEAPYQYREGQQYQQASYNPAPQQPRPAQQFNNANFDYRHQSNNNNYQAPIQTTTPYPRRFFPPGKLDLNRTPDGFNYQFQSRQ